MAKKNGELLNGMARKTDNFTMLSTSVVPRESKSLHKLLVSDNFNSMYSLLIMSHRLLISCH